MITLIVDKRVKTIIREKIDINVYTLEEAIDDLKYAIIEKYKLELLLENWDKCHNEEGLAIPPPFDYESAFLDGDFIKTVENPNGE